MRSNVSVVQTVFTDNRALDWPLYCIKALIWQIHKRLGHSFKARLENGAVIKVYPSTAYSGIFYAHYPEGKDMAFIRKHAYLADTLDHVLNVRFDSLVMKIDVEGYEEKVFLGADDLFRRQRVKLLMFERLGRTSLPNVRKFLEDRGYVIFRVNSDLSATTDDQAVSVPCINLFACPRNSFARLGE